MSCAEAIIFLSAYQAMLSVNQETIAGAQQSVAKPTLFSNPKHGQFHVPKLVAPLGALLSTTTPQRRLWSSATHHTNFDRLAMTQSKEGSYHPRTWEERRITWHLTLDHPNNPFIFFGGDVEWITSKPFIFPNVELSEKRS